MKRRLVGFLALAATFSLGACDSDSALDLSGELTELESQELGVVLLSTTLASAMTPQPAASGPAMAPFSYQGSVDGDAPCELGGVVGVSGDAAVAGDDQTGVVEIAFGLTQVHRDCVVESDEGKRFTLNGAPSIVADFDMFSGEAGGFEMGGSLIGAIQWESGGLAGVCEVNVEYSAAGNQTDGHFSAFVEGSVCGFSISHQATYGEQPVT